VSLGRAKVLSNIVLHLPAGILYIILLILMLMLIPTTNRRICGILKANANGQFK